MSYSQFRTNVACPIKQEYSGEKNEQNQIVINFLALCSHINFSLSETPTFKDFKSCTVLWLPLLWLCKAKYFCHSVAIIIFLIWSRLSFHTCAFLFFFIQKNSFLLFCSNCNFYLSLFLFAALAPIGLKQQKICAFLAWQEEESKLKIWFTYIVLSLLTGS